MAEAKAASKGKRIYIVTQLVKDSDNKRTVPEFHMVSARTAAEAIKHVAQFQFECEVATPVRAAELGAKGVAVEEAGSAFPGN
jgi:hypothetical protein